MKDKCCGNCKHLEDEGVDGFGFCVVFKCIHHCTGGGRCVAHQFNDNGWTEITPDNVEELYKSKERVCVAFICNGEVSYMCGQFGLTLSTMAKHGGYYYHVLPELKFEK